MTSSSFDYVEPAFLTSSDWKWWTSTILPDAQQESKSPIAPPFPSTCIHQPAQQDMRRSARISDHAQQHDIKKKDQLEGGAVGREEGALEEASGEVPQAKSPSPRMSPRAFHRGELT